MSIPTISESTLKEMEVIAPWLVDSLKSLLRSKPNDFYAYFCEQEYKSNIGDTPAILRCHILANDGNGRPRVSGLAKKLRGQMIDYSIPRSEIASAFKECQETKSTEAIIALEAKARSLFADVAKSGEGGEILLYFMAEHVLGLPQVLCKMPLKTSSKMHLHGVDGIHAGISQSGGLAIYWGESKLHKSITSSIQACFESIAPILNEPEGQNASSLRDVFLIRDNLDLNNEKLEAALKRFLNPDDPLYRKTEFRAICLIGFDYDKYCDLIDNKSLAITEDAKTTFDTCAKHILHAVSKEKLESFVIETFCIPFPSVDDFRRAFLGEIGLSNAS